MSKSIKEQLLSEYFLVRCVLGAHLESGKRLFSSLGKIFLIPEGEVEKLYALTENEDTLSFSSPNGYLRHIRLIKYEKDIFGKVVDPVFENISKIKGNAINTAYAKKIVKESDTSRNAVYQNLYTAIENGEVMAIRILGMLLCEGIFLEQNSNVGIKYLSQAATWNDIFSTLALLHYCNDRREYNVAKLRQLVKDTPYAELYGEAAKLYGESDEVIGEVKLLQKAFNSAVIKPDQFVPKYARIVGSSMLDIKDKEKVIFSTSNEGLDVISNLPLKLSRDNIVPIEVKQFKSVPLNRDEEIGAITRILSNGDLRTMSNYHPLCLCSDSKYLLETYKRALLTDGKNTHSEFIEVNDLKERDLECTHNNVFLRSLDEDRDNRLLIFFTGDIPEIKFDLVKNFLQTDMRAKFFLNYPSVKLDLSPVLPIVFCDERNAHSLAPYCDMIRLNGIEQGEHAAIIEEILARKQKEYGVGKVEIVGDTDEIFKDIDMDTAEQIIDKAVSFHRRKGKGIALTHADLARQLDGFNKDMVVGFGGKYI